VADLLRVITEGNTASTDSDTTPLIGPESTDDDDSDSPVKSPQPPTPTWPSRQFTEEKKSSAVYFGSEKVKCPVCPRKVTMACMEGHLNTHLPYSMRPFCCHFCQMRYAGKLQLDRHTRKNHPGLAQ
jgi:hypothetical protein